MPQLDFPRQKLSRRNKTQKWGEDCIEAGLGLIGIYDNTRRSSRFKKKRNYDLYNGKFDKSDLEHVTDPLGMGNSLEVPATLQYYDVISPIFNLLFGEEAKRAFSYVVRSVNEESITSKEEEKKNKVVSIFQQMIQQSTEQYMQSMGEPTSEEEAQKFMQGAQANVPEELKRVQKYFDYDFQDMNESSANKLLNYLEREQKLKVKFAKGWEDALLVGEEIYCVEEISNEPTVRRVNPLEFYCLLPHNEDYVDNADVLVEDTFMSVNTVIDNFYEELTSAQIDKLEKEQGNKGSIDSNSILNYPSQEKLFIENREGAENESNIFNYYDQDGNIRVTKVVWKSMRKIGNLSYFDEQGMPQETVVSEAYKLNDELGETIEWLWVNEYWEGTKIGENTYINVQVRPQQFRHMDNLSLCSSGYVGTIYNANNSQSVSLMDRLVPWVYMYITMWYRLELAVAANQGKISLIDLSLIPDGWDVEKWMYYAQTMKFGFVDSFNEGKKGQSTGKLAGNISTQNKVLDMETGNYIQQHVQLLDFVEQKIYTLSGVTPQRMGAISSSELVGNTERAVTQSSHITEKWFEVHNQTKVRVMECLLNVSKDVYRGESKRIQYMTDDMANVFFKLNGDEFASSEYGLFISNSAKDQMAIEALKQLTHAALQNEQMTLSDVVQIYNASSLSDLRHNLKQSEAKAQQRVEQQQQQQMQMQEMQVQQQQKVEEQKMQLEQAKMELEMEKENREDGRNARDNQTKLQIAQMGIMSKAADLDANDNGIKDSVDLAKLDIERVKIQKDSEEAREKIEVEKEKIRSKERIEKSKIAKQNKKI
jgi:hypothetical protein|tara:strand:+ start:5419 stop:7878 length:2460 start_codon:yes stop_codon:yes gene_type:complete